MDKKKGASEAKQHLNLCLMTQFLYVDKYVNVGCVLLESLKWQKNNNMKKYSTFGELGLENMDAILFIYSGRNLTD